MKTLLLSLLVFCIVSCASADPRRAYQEVLTGKAVMIDVRENDEVKDGMIDRALWVPLSRMKAAPEETTQEVRAISGGRTIYTYCHSGRRSQMFLDLLKEYGVDGENLGGYPDLLRAGLPVKE